jgi:tRNA pseudouridine13 synthase
MNFPLLTPGLPGIGGVLKHRPEDFIVDEIALHAADGAGKFSYARIEKTGISTWEAMRRLASFLRIPETDLGCAGLKDARAVARQTISVADVGPSRLKGVDLPGVRVLSVKRHGSALKPGMLAGNRFEVRVRSVHEDAEARTAAVLEVLLARGLPNGFGPQRFGTRGDTHLLGRALVRREFDEALSILCGRPSPLEKDPRVQEARRRFDEKDYTGARAAFLLSYDTERRVLDRLLQGGTPAQALKIAPEAMLRFYIGAYQAALFNRVLAERIEGIDRVEAGDQAWHHVTGTVALVKDVAADQKRCDAFEISPTGPIFGTTMPFPAGAPGEREARLLGSERLAPAGFHVRGIGVFEGERRPLRVPITEPEFRVEGRDLLLKFALPSGGFATNLLAEVMKSSPEAGEAE